MSLVRSHKELPAHLRTADAWKQRLREEPEAVVLADAYEYGLWRLDSDGVPARTDHPVHQTTIENFLHSGMVAYQDAIVELMRRDGYDPYRHLPQLAEAAGASDKMLATLEVVLRMVADDQLSQRAGRPSGQRCS